MSENMSLNAALQFKSLSPEIFRDNKQFAFLMKELNSKIKDFASQVFNRKTPFKGIEDSSGTLTEYMKNYSVPLLKAELSELEGFNPITKKFMPLKAWKAEKEKFDQIKAMQDKFNEMSSKGKYIEGKELDLVFNQIIHSNAQLPTISQEEKNKLMQEQMKENLNDGYTPSMKKQADTIAQLDDNYAEEMMTSIFGGEKGSGSST